MGTSYLYAGQQFDPDLGLYYNRARYWNTGTGRFWTMDTYAGNNEDPLSLHKYLYCQADPVNRVDPSGHDGDLITEDFVETEEFATQTGTAGAAGAAQASAVTRIMQSAALFAFVADSMGLFDSNPKTQIDTVKKENPDCMVFLHATSTGAWPQLADGGLPEINPNFGFKKDFGVGFYTFNASSADPGVIPSAIQWANRTASEEGGTPEVTMWLIKRATYNSMTHYDFGSLSDPDYSSQVGEFRAGRRLTTGSQVAFGEIAKYNGSAWVRNRALPFQYKFEGYSGVKALKFFGGFSPEPLH